MAVAAQVRCSAWANVVRNGSAADSRRSTPSLAQASLEQQTVETTAADILPDAARLQTSSTSILTFAPSHLS